MKTLIVVLSAVVLLVIAAAHGYRIYAGIPISVAAHDVPMMCSWYAAIGSALLGQLLLLFGRK